MRLTPVVLLALLALSAKPVPSPCPVTYGYCEVWRGECKSGTTQSPIASNASGRHADPSLPNPVFSYPLTALTATNNRVAIKVTSKEKLILHYGKADYRLDEFHFHTPAEHRIDIWMKPPNAVLAELHMVHKDAAGNAVAVAVPIRLGDSNPVLAALRRLAPIGVCDKKTTRPVDVTKLLPAVKGRYITYVGSLTTPDCDPGVRFVMMNDGITATQEELNFIKVICNARPVQYNENPVTYREATPND